MNVPPLVREIYRDIGIGVLLIKAAVVDGEEFIDKISRFVGIRKWIERQGERRHTMEKYLKLIPILEKLTTDLEAAAQSPQDEAVVADIKALIADISAA